MKRIKKWLTLIPVILVAGMLALSPATAMAQEEDGATVNPDYPFAGSLAIVAPALAPENQEISMRVFLRWDQEPVQGAGIWAFTRDQAEVMKEAVKRLSEDTSIAPEEKDYESLADVHGTFIGRTGVDGRLYHSFEESGTYLLAAVKRGYYPGFTTIRIGTRPRALVLDAPDRAAVNEEVLMTVTGRGTGEPVEGAGIWALSRENVEQFAAEIEALRTDSVTADSEIDFESLADIYGTFLGQTNERGQLTHAFGEVGGYLLVTVKRGYLPARSGIRIGDPTPKVLAIHAPARAIVGSEVTMTVVNRPTGEPVQGAGVWAVSRDRIESFQADMTALKESATLQAADTDFESMMDIYGEFLGRTDESGQLNHVFNQEGGYLLVTVKRGYFPGWTGIRIIEPKESSDMTAEVERTVGKNLIKRVSPSVQLAPITVIEAY